MFSKIAAVAAALLALPLTITPASAHQLPHGPVSMAVAVDLLPPAAESREGYQRSSFKHWVDADHDGCSTRAEVLIAESRVQPTIEAGCKVTAGQWFSFYDGVTVTAPGSLDIDHMVPLAEAWDSGASAWTSERREAYANDLDAENSLVAVTARANRSKADQDPADWLAPLLDARCSYVGDWVATKLRWTTASGRHLLRSPRGVGRSPSPTRLLRSLRSPKSARYDDGLSVCEAGRRPNTLGKCGGAARTAAGRGGRRNAAFPQALGKHPGAPPSTVLITTVGC